MFYEIELLESIVQGHLSECPVKNQDNTTETLELISLDKLIQKALINYVFELKKDRLIEIYIRDVQKRLIKLSNDLYLYISSKGEQSLDLLNTIENLLFFLSKTFPDYINNEIDASEKVKNEAVLNLKDKVVRLEKLYQGNNKELFEIALKPIKEFLTTMHPISYNKLNYFNIYIRELANSFEISLKEQLVKLNFNSYSFIHYLSQEIISDLEELESIPEKIGTLFWHMKWIKQIQIREISYHVSRKSIKDLFIDWLNEEINYLEKSVTLEKLPQAELRVSEQNDFKLITDLSVPQIGFLLRVFMDSGLFKNKSHRAVANFFAKHTKTKGSSAVSPGNLLNKFYDVNGNAEEVVKGILIKMLNEIHKN